jgi:3'5'-cyclic nucleotide phosphodiesterase
MSVTKLLARIVAPNEILETFDDPNQEESNRGRLASSLHDHTYGITSDPLTQFAVILSALIHDVDHQGVPNTTLVAENCSIATIYENKSVAEQNSVDLAWALLMDDRYKMLRAAIYATDDEAKRFRQLVVNTVLATDIMDKDLKGLRNARWEKAFIGEPDTNPRDAINRKATIVIEHLIQASDVAHTMQHWHVYRKWNERLFQEMYKAYKIGRSEKNPADFWYQGEMGFFDFYIIPLAKKLKECGVFGVSSDEYLDYALANRKEWEDKGQEVVAELLQNCAKECLVWEQTMV